MQVTKNLIQITPPPNFSIYSVEKFKYTQNCKFAKFGNITPKYVLLCDENI
jgi:hypothetical protein